MKNRRPQNKFVRAIKKSLLTAFLVGSFGAYALENRAAAGGDAAAPSVAIVRPTGTPSSAARPAPTEAPAAGAGSSGGTASSAAPTPTPKATATATSPAPAVASSGYKDGTYTGSPIDVNWGYVQVQATVQNGKISNVQFLEYPNDRRTSVRINSFAVPTLRQEAIQAQSANVDLITGATLTSEGFQVSLQDALSQAQG